MKNLNSLLAGIFLAVAFPFGTLVVSSQMQLGPLGRAPAEEGGPLFPSREPGLAIQGRAVYVSLGCVSCHTQQVRPAGQGSDIARGYGVRASVARDYVLQKPVLLGERRIGPDLANYRRPRQGPRQRARCDPARRTIRFPLHRCEAGSRHRARRRPGRLPPISPPGLLLAGSQTEAVNP